MILKIHERCTEWVIHKCLNNKHKHKPNNTPFKIEIIISVQFKIQLETTLKLGLPQYWG